MCHSERSEESAFLRPFFSAFPLRTPFLCVKSPRHLKSQISNLQFPFVFFRTPPTPKHSQLSRPFFNFVEGLRSDAPPPARQPIGWKLDDYLDRMSSHVV
jgi:hypothetical protein